MIKFELILISFACSKLPAPKLQTSHPQKLLRTLLTNQSDYRRSHARNRTYRPPVIPLKSRPSPSPLQDPSHHTTIVSFPQIEGS